MNVGIVGHAAEKFTQATRDEAVSVINRLLSEEGAVLVSGRSPMGGVDVWAEEWAVRRRIPTRIFPPAHPSWEYFKERNIAIAVASDILNVIVVDQYPVGFTGKRFDHCYHCAGKDRPPHVKSGACWTANHAISLGKPVAWYVVTGRPAPVDAQLELL